VDATQYKTCNTWLDSPSKIGIVCNRGTCKYERLKRRRSVFNAKPFRVIPAPFVEPFVS